MANNPNLKTHRADYQETLSQVKDPYKYSEQRDAILSNKISEANERVRAFPNDENEHECLIQLIMEAQAMWEECEDKLRFIASDKNADRTLIAAQINQAHAKACEYQELHTSSLKNMLANTSKLYQAGNAMASAGQTIQDVGSSMKSVGHSMTSGCTIPIIILLLILLLLMIL